MNPFASLSPALLWNYFYEITQIPRPSKHETAIINHLKAFAESKNLLWKQDGAGNLLILKGGSTGNESKETVVLQAHVDMVCEKNNTTEFDFFTQPLDVFVQDGWVKARGTTLGADDGIGVAAMMAVLADDSLVHGPLECLFTIDEETGLTGALALEKGFITGKTLLNLDSEDWGEVFVGCAGGVNTVANFRPVPEMIPAGYMAFKILVSGLKGGHSGSDIHFGLGNAIKILANFLYVQSHKQTLWLADINGGNLHNAIPREASAVVFIPAIHKEQIRIDLNIYADEVQRAFALSDPDISIHLESTEAAHIGYSAHDSVLIISSLVVCPHGVFYMSKSLPGLVETSTNLASVKTVNENLIEVVTSQRSSNEFRKHELKHQVAASFKIAGAEVRHSDGYPGWNPNLNSPILKTTKAVHEALLGETPEIKAIHAGLECGLFLEKYPELDMVSIGPTILGAHSPDERLNILTAEKFWKLLVGILEAVTH